MLSISGVTSGESCILSFSLAIFGGHTYFLTPTVKVCDFEACIDLDTHFLLNCDLIYLIKWLKKNCHICFQESVELLGPVEIHVRRTESVTGVLPTYIRI